MTITLCREDWTPGLTYEIPPQEFVFIPANFEDPEVLVSPHYPAPPLQIHCCMVQHQPYPPSAAVPEPGTAGLVLVFVVPLSSPGTCIAGGGGGDDLHLV